MFMTWLCYDYELVMSWSCFYKYMGYLCMHFFGSVLFNYYAYALADCMVSMMCINCNSLYYL